ncbi:hypothetical protein [Kineosporia sp. R_H_3]|uniref:hypothetical protein n=1 Tax=Kineosporia sp. R_H_3 TaxID=1961848 RepID=UPI000B4ABF56|nr:hypothetical protein [Kineosporia sp. R_H_3]
MTTVETLIAAAEKLELLDKAATPAPWLVREDYDDLVLATEAAVDPDGDGLAGSYRCTDRIAGHDFTIYDEDDDQERQVRATFALIATMRPLAGVLAKMLRREAGCVETANATPNLVPLAEAVLAAAAEAGVTA